MIELDNLYKSFDKKQVLDGLSLKIEDGDLFGLLGPNGAGKSTTLKIITGILSPDSGDVFINNNSIKINPIGAKREFGFVSDTPDMFLGMKGIDYLKFVSSVYQVDETLGKERILKYSDIFELTTSLNDYIANYSHGMRQKLFIIASLIHQPKNWILDEPITGLDPNSVYELKQIMIDYAKSNHCVLFSTHVLDIAEKLCTKIGILSKGKIVFCGSFDQLKAMRNENNESLEEIFLEMTNNNE